LVVGISGQNLVGVGARCPKFPALLTRQVHRRSHQLLAEASTLKFGGDAGVMDIHDARRKPDKPNLSHVGSFEGGPEGPLVSLILNGKIEHALKVVYRPAGGKGVDFFRSA